MLTLLLNAIIERSNIIQTSYTCELWERRFSIPSSHSRSKITYPPYMGWALVILVSRTYPEFISLLWDVIQFSTPSGYLAPGTRKPESTGAFIAHHLILPIISDGRNLQIPWNLKSWYDSCESNFSQLYSISYKLILIFYPLKST